MSASPTDVRSLLAAARDDTPDAMTHEAMWDRVALATGAAAGAATIGAAAATSSKVAIAPGAKLLIVGALIGAASSALGVLVTVGVLQSDTAIAVSVRPAAPRSVRVAEAGARRADPEPRRRDPSRIALRAEAAAPSRPAAATGFVSELTEEARLVTDARAALVLGDPERALALVRSTRRLSTRALEPEELGLEARALRALGRADEAAATELLLRRRFPAHALAR
jgi:hypothetical protein